MSWRVTQVSPLDEYRLQVTFFDGTTGEADLSKLVTSEKSGVFAVLRDRNLFNKVYLNYGAITWPGEIDLAPEVLYRAIKRSGKWEG